MSISHGPDVNHSNECYSSLFEVSPQEERPMGTREELLPNLNGEVDLYGARGGLYQP